MFKAVKYSIIYLLTQILFVQGAVAGSPSISFSATVANRTSLENSVRHSQTIVTFSSQVAIPVGEGAERIRIFGDNMEITDLEIIRTTAQTGTQTLALVHIGSRPKSSIVVCNNNMQQCVKFNVQQL